jgi:uncharacterized membrane protein YeiH
MNQVSALLPWLDYVGIAVFAAAGALGGVAQAARYRGLRRSSPAVTAVGGGTLRDVLLDMPVFWVRNPAYLGIPLAASPCVVYFTAHLCGVPLSGSCLWADAIGSRGLCGGG